MKIQRIGLIFLGLCSLAQGAQVSVKSKEDLFVGAAGAGKTDNLEIGLKNGASLNSISSFGQSALGMAAGFGHLNAVQWLLARGANPNIQDKGGLTPLAWATFMNNLQRPGNPKATKTEQDYINVINALLAAGARTDILDNGGLSVLHGAARSGSLATIKLLLDNGAQRLINHEGRQDKGRTPLMEAIRAARDAITHVDLENKDISNQAEFEKALTEAIDQLKDKEARKLSTNQIVAVINLLKRYGANTNMVDALGHTADYYINEVQLISDAERIQLLQALNFPVTNRIIIKYQLSDLPQAIVRLQNLQAKLGIPVVTRKIQMLIWAILAAQRESNRDRQYNILQIGMALIAKIKELIKEAIPDKARFNELENELNNIRTILRDTALVGSNKARLTPQPAAQPQPVAAPAQVQKAPVVVPVKPAAAQPPAITTAAPQGQKKMLNLDINSMYITDLYNYSAQPAGVKINFPAGTYKEFVAASAKSKNVPFIEEVARAGQPKGPISIESFNQKVILEIIPGESGKPTRVKRQFINSQKPITYWNLSDVRQAKIIIEENGDIKIVPDNKVTIVNAPVQPSVQPAVAPVAAAPKPTAAPAAAPKISLVPTAKPAAVQAPAHSLKSVINMTKSTAIAHLPNGDVRLAPNQQISITQKLEGILIIETDSPQDMMIEISGSQAKITGTGAPRTMPLTAKNYNLIIRPTELLLAPLP